ncbi:MerR family transcriptional regulator [Streptomyces kunmingensis]|uniref:MerR family transcriptional regulator n=1 Tax=Streptomyces kunmingensis TaxID=68225 RepID=A0ABU6C6Y7_9ACTN|nr:MerR family transcriptional regulator [Streptomyces kunmingensis]MEB3960468.1 MerR family transcriptional regulator [Streptomyces kunmingensis]
MGLLTIGMFARASRLSPKALRLYDELGLLPPARVDPVTGYRLYAPDQLDQARLIAWLRRLGMPLTRIERVCALEAGPAAQEIRAFWAQAEAETVVRRDLAAFLIDHLSRKDPAMSPTVKSLGIRHAVLSDAGRVRESNQDMAYAGSRLLAVADGFGGRGGSVSAAAVDALKRLEADGIQAGDLLNVLEDAIAQAEQAVHGFAGRKTETGAVTETATGSTDREAGTTLTAMLWTGSQLALVHIGDTRGYLLRDGELFQITHDHTMVQSMIDEGRLSPEEAVSHPQRSLLIRALGQGADGTPDLRLHDALEGDRYLLCSDGLSSFVRAEEIRRVLSDAAEPGRAVRELVALANDSGGDDNVSCVVADVVTLP